MKQLILAGAFAAVVFAQGPAAPAATGNPEIDKVVVAAPAQSRAGAMVIKWKPDYTYDTVRPATGTNTWVCFDKSTMPGQQPFSIECTSSAANLKRVAQNLKFEAITDQAARRAALAAAEKDGTREKPEFGSAWIHMTGRDQATARMHTTIAVPMATEKSMALPETGAKGGIWIMDAGTTTAHLMIPGQ